MSEAAFALLNRQREMKDLGQAAAVARSEAQRRGLVCQFRVDGAPLAWARARRSGDKYYKSGKQVAAQSSIGWAARAAFGSGEALEGPLGVAVIVTVERPKSAAGREWPTVKPDVDNFAKQVLDACNGIVWKDDAQVCALLPIKIYGDSPGLDVRVWSLVGRNFGEAFAPAFWEGEGE